jgi:hypothetical protein
MSGILSQLAAVAGLVAAAIVFCIVARALWAEIGPMLALLFRRAPLRALRDEDETPSQR